MFRIRTARADMRRMVLAIVPIPKWYAKKIIKKQIKKKRIKTDKTSEKKVKININQLKEKRQEVQFFRFVFKIYESYGVALRQCRTKVVSESAI
jgi:hypothetical protein